MIRGFGTDIVDISRIERLLNKYNSHFKEKIYTPSEIDYCEAKAAPAIHYAGRWAVKEAFYKALPVACQRYSGWKGIEVILSVGNGKPVIQICSNELKKHLEKEQITEYHMSISHERKYCIASVVLE
jgi:holo-[acyl-carrier protein] synthase